MIPGAKAVINLRVICKKDQSNDAAANDMRQVPSTGRIHDEGFNRRAETFPNYMWTQKNNTHTVTVTQLVCASCAH